MSPHGGPNGTCTRFPECQGQDVTAYTMGPCPRGFLNKKTPAFTAEVLFVTLRVMAYAILTKYSVARIFDTVNKRLNAI